MAWLQAWLDSDSEPNAEVLTFRLLKLMGEMGEVAEAYITWRGQNPRKSGVTREKVVKEVCDVIATGMVALGSLVGLEAEQVFSEHMDFLVGRAAATREGKSCPGHPEEEQPHMCRCRVDCNGSEGPMPGYVRIAAGGSIEVGEGGQFLLAAGSVIEALPEGGVLIKIAPSALAVTR